MTNVELLKRSNARIGRKWRASHCSQPKLLFLAHLFFSVSIFQHRIYFSIIFVFRSVLFIRSEVEMGLFGSSSQFDAMLDKACSEQNTNEDWSLILSICDRAKASPKHSKDCLAAIVRKMQHKIPRVALQGKKKIEKFTFKLK